MTISLTGPCRAAGAEKLSGSNWTPPAGYAAQRYEALWKRSPFTLSSISDATGSKTSSFALAGYLKIGSSEYVTLVNRQSHETFFVSSEPNAQGLKLVSVQPSADPLKVTAQISRADVAETVGYDPAILSAPVKGAPPVQVASATVNPGPVLVPVPEPNTRPERAPHAERHILRPTPILPPANQ